VLSAAAARKLRLLVPILGSTHDGEIIGAARAIDRTLKSDGCDWHTLTAHLLPAAQPRGGPTWAPPPPEQEPADLARWEYIVARCANAPNVHFLSGRDRAFLSGLHIQVCIRQRPPSVKQRSWLAGIVEKLGLDVVGL